MLSTLPTDHAFAKAGMQKSHEWIAGLFLFATNTVAWLDSAIAGQVVTSLTILVMGLVSLYVFARAKLVESRNKERLAQIGQDAEIETLRDRKERERRDEREKADRSSLITRLKQLQDSVDEGNRRTEDANRKLHDQKNQHHADALCHAEDMHGLREQLKFATRMLEEANDELHDLRVENKELASHLESIEAETRGMNRRSVENAAKIDILADQIAPTSLPPTPNEAKTP